MGCALCGKSHGLRSERCWITEDTQRVLVAHAAEFHRFGVTLTEDKPLQKDFGTTVSVIGLVLAVADSLDGGVLRKLVIYLHKLGISRNEILRLRLCEPEDVDRAFNEMEELEKKLVAIENSRTALQTVWLEGKDRDEIQDVLTLLQQHRSATEAKLKAFRLEGGRAAEFHITPDYRKFAKGHGSAAKLSRCADAPLRSTGGGYCSHGLRTAMPVRA